MATITTLGFSIVSTYSGRGVTAARRDLVSLNATMVATNASSATAARGLGTVAAAAVSLAPALIPIAAAATSTTGALVAMGVGAGTSLGVYGAAMAGAIKKTNDMAAAGKKLDPVQKAFIASTKGMSGAWNEFISKTQNITLSVATTAIQGVSGAIKQLTPLVFAVHPQIQALANDFKNWAAGDGFKRFIDTVIQFGVPALEHLISAGKAVMSVLGTGFRAFAPLGVQVAAALERGALAMKGWADGGGFQRFIESVQKNAPAVRAFFDALGGALKNVFIAMQGLGPLSLGLATTLLRIVAALPPSWIQAIVVGFVAWRAALLGLMIIQGIITLVNAFKLAWVTLNFVFAASPIGVIITAIVALIAVIVLIATKTTWFQTIWNAAWNGIKVAASAVWSALQVAWNAFVNALVTTWNVVGGALRTAWTAVWNAIKVAGQAVWNAIRVAWQAVITAISTVTTTYMNIVRTAWTAAWNAIRTAGVAVWNAMRTAWTAVMNAIRTTMTTVMNALRTAWTSVWNAIRTAGQAVWNALRTAFTAFMNAMRTTATSVLNAIKSVWSSVWNAIKSAAQAVWNAMKAAGTAFMNALKAVMTSVLNAIKSLWNSVWNAIKTATNAVWNSLKSLATAFMNALRNTFNTVMNAIKSLWNNAWNAVKNTANSIWNAIRAIWNKFLDGVRSKANTFISGIKKAFSDAWNSIKSTANKVWHEIGEIIEKAVNGVITVVNGLISGFNKIASFLKIDVKVSEIGKVNFNFAEGGMVPAQHFATGGVANYRAGGTVPGYSPGRDTVPAMLSPGEGVLTPEAVRGLGGPGFVHSANRTYAGHRGAGRGAANLNKFTGQHEGPQSRGQFAHGGIVQHFAVGGLVSAALARAGGGFSITQGEYSNSVAASAGTHSGGGVVDIAAGPGDYDMVARLRAAGFAAWLRTPAEGFAYHIHAVLMNHPDLSPAARSQVASYLAGGNGLANGGADTGGGIDIFGIIKDNVGKILLNVYKGAQALAGIGGGIADFFGMGGDKEDDDGGGFLGTGIGPDIGPDIPGADIVGDAVRGGVKMATGGLGGMLGQMVLSFLDKGNIAEGLSDAKDKFGAIGSIAGGFGDMALGLGKKVLDSIIPDFLLKKKEEAGPMDFAGLMGGGGGVQQWAGLAAMALKLGGLSASQLPAFLALMQAESGGNPGAVNLYDSNAAMGQASRGLMQVIPSTFAAYHVAGTSSNILDPLANMAAAAAYIKARYGGNVPGSPYAAGTNNATRGWHLVGENGPEMRYFRGGERVANARETQRLLWNRHGGGRGPGDGGVVIQDGAIRIDARGASVDAVKRMETELVPKLRMAVQAGCGKRR